MIGIGGFGGFSGGIAGTASTAGQTDAGTFTQSMRTMQTSAPADPPPEISSLGNHMPISTGARQFLKSIRDLFGIGMKPSPLPTAQTGGRLNIIA